jgi:hypothetical protein
MQVILSIIIMFFHLTLAFKAPLQSYGRRFLSKLSMNSDVSYKVAFMFPGQGGTAIFSPIRCFSEIYLISYIHDISLYILYIYSSNCWYGWCSLQRLPCCKGIVRQSLRNPRLRPLGQGMTNHYLYQRIRT